MSLGILAVAGNRRLQKCSKSFRANSSLRKCDFAPCFSYTGGVGLVVPSSVGQRVRLLITPLLIFEILLLTRHIVLIKE